MAVVAAVPVGMVVAGEKLAAPAIVDGDGVGDILRRLGNKLVIKPVAVGGDHIRDLIKTDAVRVYFYSDTVPGFVILKVDDFQQILRGFSVRFL